MMRYERSDNKWTKTKEDLGNASKNKILERTFPTEKEAEDEL